MSTLRYALTFMEGIITFISPCLLPMLPIYVSYFAGGEDGSTAKTLRNAAGFVTGFTMVFVALGAFAGTLGGLMWRYQTAVNIVTGVIVMLLGLGYLGVIRFNLPGVRLTGKPDVKRLGFFSSLVFGAVFSISWTPCVSAFLGSALMMASQQGSAVQGVLLLLCYSLGLGLPFFLSAILISRLKSAFGLIKRNYGLITKLSGGLLVVVGVLMMTGWMGRFLSMLSA